MPQRAAACRTDHPVRRNSRIPYAWPSSPPTRIGRPAADANPCSPAPHPAIRTCFLSSCAHLVSEFRQRFLADAFDFQQLVDIVETADLIAIVDDALRGHGADAFQGLQFVGSCGVDVQQTVSRIGGLRWSGCWFALAVGFRGWLLAWCCLRGRRLVFLGSVRLRLFGLGDLRLLERTVVDGLLDEHGQACAERARQGEYGDDRVDWLEDESWTVAFGPVLFSRFVGRLDAGQIPQCGFCGFRRLFSCRDCSGRFSRCGNLGY